MGTIDSLLSGSIDMHVHAGPDPRLARRVDALEAAKQARALGMRAIVLKSHDYPTAPVAYIVNQVVDNFTVYGSISLDFEVGGLNVAALEASAQMGAKVAWMYDQPQGRRQVPERLQRAKRVMPGESGTNLWPVSGTKSL